jgi:PAS domain S-box-containing protein
MQMNLAASKNGTSHADLTIINGTPMKTLPQTETSILDEKVNILMVDDTPENLVALEAILGDLNQNLIKATSGREALRCLLRQDFAVILLDVNMPEINGFETAALIRQRKSSEHTPIIFLSAISTAEMYSAKGYALGAVDYIAAPIIPDVLRTKVTVFVELLKKTEEIKRQAEQLRQVEEAEHQRQLNEAEGRLEMETKRNRFFQLSIDMLSIAGFNGYFKQLNPTWKTVLGFTEDELKASPFMDFIHPDDQAMTLDQIQKLKTNELSVYFESRYACKNGSYRWLAWTAAPFIAEELIYLFARDVTERKQSEEEIRKLNTTLEQRAVQLETTNQELQREIAVRKRAEAALKETNSELESFSYSVSHDLRAPLRAMQGFAEALLEDCGPELGTIGKDYADRIIAAAGRMDSLIQDLLLYSRLSHAALQLQTVDLRKAIAEALCQLEATLREANAEVVVEEPMASVIGHHATAVQVLCNLVSNAVKFVGAGVKPLVRVRLQRNGEWGRLWVEDNGIGISAEYHNRIFRVFERLHGIDIYPGTGIGLAIVRKGAERMGGRVGLESATGQGSKFWVDLPLAPAADLATK